MRVQRPGKAFKDLLLGGQIRSLRLKKQNFDQCTSYVQLLCIISCLVAGMAHIGIVSMHSNVIRNLSQITFGTCVCRFYHCLNTPHQLSFTPTPYPWNRFYGGKMEDFQPAQVHINATTRRIYVCIDMSTVIFLCIK